jgi:uncharacterized membrane protein YqaE (UPF0057 family)
VNRTKALTGAALALHGPGDVLTTLYGRATCPYDPEGNPLVASMDPTAWLGVKALALAPLAVVWTVESGGKARLLIDVLLAVLVLLGLVATVGNAYVITKRC